MSTDPEKAPLTKPRKQVRLKRISKKRRTRLHFKSSPKNIAVEVKENLLTVPNSQMTKLPTLDEITQLLGTKPGMLILEKGLSFLEKSVQELREANTPEKVLIAQCNLLNDFYQLAHNQAKQSFIYAIVAAMIGLFIFIIAAIIVFTERASNLAITTTLASAFIELVSALFFYLYKKALEQLNYFEKQINHTQGTLLAIKLSNEMSSEKGQLEKSRIIGSIMFEDGKERKASVKTNREDIHLYNHKKRQSHRVLKRIFSPFAVQILIILLLYIAVSFLIWFKIIPLVFLMVVIVILGTEAYIYTGLYSKKYRLARPILGVINGLFFGYVSLRITNNTPIASIAFVSLLLFQGYSPTLFRLWRTDKGHSL